MRKDKVTINYLLTSRIIQSKGLGYIYPKPKLSKVFVCFVLSHSP